MRCERALPAEDFDALPVEELESVFDALRAAGLDVTSFLAIALSLWGLTPELRGAAKRHPLERIVRPQLLLLGAGLLGQRASRSGLGVFGSAAVPKSL